MSAVGATVPRTEVPDRWGAKGWPGTSGAWTVVSVGAAGGAQLGIIVLLSRLLDEVSFGAAAAVIALLSLPRILVDAVLTAPVVQRQALPVRAARTAATLALGISALVMVTLWLTAPLFEVGFAIDGLSGPVRLVALSLPLFGLAATPQGVLARRLDFRSLAVIDVVALLVGYLGVGALAAMLGAGVHAVAIAFLVEGLVRAGLTMVRQPVFPTVRPDREVLRQFGRYAGSTGVGSLLNLVATRGDYLVVSRLAGPVALAAYTQAYQLAYNPGLILSRVVNRWLFPVLARSGSGHDVGPDGRTGPDGIRDGEGDPAEVFVTNLERLGLITGAAAVALAVLAPELVDAAFGARWSVAVPPLQIMALALPARILHSIHDAQLKAVGAVDQRAAIQGVYACAVIALVFLGARFSLPWASGGLVVAILLNYVLMATRSSRTLDIGHRRLIAAHRPVVTGAIATGLVLVPTVLGVRTVTSASWTLLLATSIVIGALVAALAIGGRRPGSAPLSPGAETGIAAPPIPMVKALLEDFARADVPAIFFKGRHRLDRALSGIGDIDLHVPADRRDGAASVLARRGFILAPDARWPTARYLTDWFGPGEDGRLVHVQLHHRAIVGGPRGPVVEIPGAAGLVAGAEGEAIRVASPADGAVVRLADAALRWPVEGDRLTETIGVGRSVASAEFRAACDGLFDDAEVTTAALSLRERGDRSSARALRRALTADRNRVVVGRPSVRSVLRSVGARLNRGTLRLAILPRRRLASAPIVAVIGSDGAGKSTVTRGLIEGMGAKIDTRFLYLGTGDGPTSLPRLPLVWLRRLWEARETREVRFNEPASAPGHAEAGGSGTAVPSTAVPSTAVPSTAGPSDGRRDVPELARIAWAVSTVFERRSRVRQARRASGRGFVVICDRYPQAGLVGMFDGPRLRDPENLSSLGRRVARWERSSYARMNRFPPDLVLLLDVGAETAMARRPDERADELRRRTEAARTLRYGTAHHVTIDAEQPADEVLRQAVARVLEACS